MEQTDFKALRLTQNYRQTIHAQPEKIFPLLCPVSEAQWLDGWQYQMIFSESGRVEQGAVFRTPGLDEPDTDWVVTRHDPSAHKVEFIRITPFSRTCLLNISVLSQDETTSQVDISYTYTGLSPAGNDYIVNLSEADFITSMKFWEESMNHFLKSGHKLERSAF